MRTRPCGRGQERLCTLTHHLYCSPCRPICSGGNHLILGQTVPWAQADTQLITSYTCYITDIALALRPERLPRNVAGIASSLMDETLSDGERLSGRAHTEALYARGMSNSWGYLPPRGEPSCVCTNVQRSSSPGDEACQIHTCYATVLEVGSMLFTHSRSRPGLLRSPPKGDTLAFNHSHKEDIARNAKCFCRDRVIPETTGSTASTAAHLAAAGVYVVKGLRDPAPSSMTGAPLRRIHEYNLPWMPDVRWFRCIDGASLDPNARSPSEQVWPARCGLY